jgi:hypothetical protein
VRMGEHRGARMEPHDLADGNDGSASQLVQ